MRHVTKKKILLLVLVQLLCFQEIVSTEETVYCPSKCVCTQIHSRPKVDYKLKCGGGDEKISSIQELNLQDFSFDIFHLDLSDNNITHLQQEAFTYLLSLQKLNLSRSHIYSIENEAFANLTNLKRLDLYGNRLKFINIHTFAGLENLEKLVLSQNFIMKIKEGTFDELISLKQLDLSGNPLLCDCELGWLLEWSRNVSVKLTSSPKCGAPPPLRGQFVRKLRVGVDFHCNWTTSGPGFGTLLELKPAHSQVVFAGDSLKLRCRAPTAGTMEGERSIANVRWKWGSQDPSKVFNEIIVENRYIAGSGLVESSLSIKHLQRNHSGKWNCRLVSEEGNQTQTISVIVISDDTQYCPQTVTSNNKGVYTWPKTVVGYTVELQCEGEQLTGLGRLPLRAQYTCTESGVWEALNTTLCPYVSETTKILEQFAKVNLSVAKGSVLESAKRLKNFTNNGKQLRDKMDVVFISRTVENYLDYVTKEKELGSQLVDIVSTLMHLPKDLLTAAQVEDRACSRLVRAVELVAEFTPSLQSHKSNLAVEEYRVNRERFSGLSCTWYTYAGKNSGRHFHCSTSNTTALLGTKVVEASIQVPASLFYQLEMQGHSIASGQQLVVSVYENNRLFPRIVPDPSQQDGRDITSCVIGTKLVGIEVQNLTHPVYVMLRAPLLHHTAGSPKPVWWDSLMNNGTGGWSQTGCQLSHFVHGLLVFQCNRLGYFGLLQKDIFLYDHMGRVSGAKFRFSHPAVYVGSVVGVISLMVAIVTYIICHASIQMSKKTKHSLINTWVAMALLCFMYSLGIHQTEDVKICQGVGLLLHYLTLSSLLWMAVTASNMYKRLTKSDSLDSAPDDELPPDQPVAQKPLLGLYLVGWGIALIVCGISGAVNMREYAGYSHCFLMPGPALSAVFVPMGLLVLFLLVFFLLIHCGIQNLDTNGQLSEGTQATENVDLDLLDSNITNTATAERTSLHSASTPTASSDVEDLEHSPQSQLKAHVIVLLLYLLMWTSAAFATAKPLKNYLPYDEIIFSILYGLLASCLGMFVSFFYCVARSDVRAQWHLMECWCRRRRGRCCRTRSISDTNPSLPPSQPLAPVPNIGPRSANQAQPVSSSNSINSSAQTAKSHNSSVAKAAVELNGTVKCDFETGTKISNVNLIVLHRQQYRSNNSVTTFTEASGASGAEMFYNPHQSTVARKFFRKQRRHMKHNNLGARRRGDGGGGTSDGGSNTRAESAVFLSSDMENTSGKVAPSIYAPGSKVNNTNIHVEHPHHSRHREKSQNPNVLTDSGGDEVAIDSQNLPLERLVIGAEETSTSAPLNNDGTPRSPASGCGSTSGNNRIKSVEELPEEVTLLTTELNKMESEMQQVNNLSKDDVDNKLQCYSNNSCDKFPVQRTGSSTSVADTRKTWQDDSADGKGNGSDLVTCSAPCNTQIKTEPLDLDCVQQKLHDNSSAASSGGDLSDMHHKHVYRGSLHRRNSEHSKQEKSYTDIDSMAQPPENLLKE
ncbi:adhesion G protein-coupled receptor A3 isoform X2 [Periplaneta americana]|uniref:adhesion G protein-coupled receptor A3 isoform X2 n=1 Tax=Periplaneta americana TaxID=6978 RepID=UPI0037E857EF